MVLDLRPFDTVKGVSFNELFKLVPNPFSNPNSFGKPDYFGNPDSSKNPDKFENLSIFSGICPDPEKISCFRPDPIFQVLAHL